MEASEQDRLDLITVKLISIILGQRIIERAFSKISSLENEPVYELRESTQEYLMKAIEEIFAEVDIP